MKSCPSSLGEAGPTAHILPEFTGSLRQRGEPSRWCGLRMPENSQILAVMGSGCDSRGGLRAGMKFKRSSGQHSVASISHHELCAGTLVVVRVGLAGVPGSGSSAPQEQSRWGGNEVRARDGNFLSSTPPSGSVPVASSTQMGSMSDDMESAPLSLMSAQPPSRTRGSDWSTSVNLQQSTVFQHVKYIYRT